MRSAEMRAAARPSRLRRRASKCTGCRVGRSPAPRGSDRAPRCKRPRPPPCVGHSPPRASFCNPARLPSAGTGTPRECRRNQGGCTPRVRGTPGTALAAAATSHSCCAHLVHSPGRQALAVAAARARPNRTSPTRRRWALSEWATDSSPGQRQAPWRRPAPRSHPVLNQRRNRVRLLFLPWEEPMEGQ